MISIKVYESILKGADFDCVFCSSPEEALDIIKSEQISGLITDLIMPNISGIDLIKAVNEHQDNCFKFLITGDVSLDIILFSVNELNIDQILIKPITIGAENLKKLILKLTNSLPKESLKSA